jgi:hypothetical protein
MANPQHHNHSELIMPVYSEETFFYEVLLRFGETDPNKGKLTGASLTQITQLTRDGSVLNSTINLPEQLALVDGENGQKLSDVLGEVNANTIIENQSLSNALVSEQASTATLTEQLTAAQAEIERLTEELADQQLSAGAQDSANQAEI